MVVLLGDVLGLALVANMCPYQPTGRRFHNNRFLINEEFNSTYSKVCPYRLSREKMNI